MVWWLAEVGNWGLHFSGLLRRVGCGCLPTFRDSLSFPHSVCPATSVNNYRSTLRANPEERRLHLHRGGSLISRHVTKLLSCPWVRTSSVAHPASSSVGINKLIPWSFQLQAKVTLASLDCCHNWRWGKSAKSCTRRPVCLRSQSDWRPSIRLLTE